MLITNQMLPDGNTRCWDSAGMYEVKSLERYRGNDPNHCWRPGNPDDNKDERGRPILGKTDKERYK